MLYLTLSKKDLFDEENERFISLPPVELQLEHSLSSLSKWESKYKKPFLTNTKKFAKTKQEMLDYYIMMSQGEVDPNVFSFMTVDESQQIDAYLKDPQTATWIDNSMSTKSATMYHEEITAEVIYTWLVMFNIPFEVQYWNINRLLTFIQVYQIKQSGTKPQPVTSDYLNQRRELNEQRKALYQTNG